MDLLGIFIGYPALALVPAALFVGFWIVGRQKVSLVAGLLWALYSGYEYLMKLRILCSGECNIRVDLLLIYPMLVLVSLVALIRLIRRNATRTVAATK
jgi:hypothetical protein